MENFANSGNTTKKTILLIDDEEFFRTSTTDMLKNDYHVITANSGIEALELLNQGIVPDAILLDLVMPDMDGWATFEKAKDICSKNKIPIAFFTSSFEIEIIKKAFNVGVNEYISKPINKKELMKVIKKMLKQ